MSKTEKNNHSKVPKITEAEYTAYVNRIQELSEENAYANTKKDHENNKNREN